MCSNRWTALIITLKVTQIFDDVHFTCVIHARVPILLVLYTWIMTPSELTNNSLFFQLVVLVRRWRSPDELVGVDPLYAMYRWSREVWLYGLWRVDLCRFRWPPPNDHGPLCFGHHWNVERFEFCLWESITHFDATNSKSTSLWWVTIP